MPHSLLILALSLNQWTGRPACPWATKTQSATGRRSSLKVVIIRNAPSRIKNLNDPVEQSIEPDSRISPAILPEGYNGKILLVSVSGDEIEKAVLLRSGDMWHREILRNAEVEIKNLGFKNALVHQLGGAHVRFKPDGTIIIYGASQEFGACDKEFAGELVRDLFPERRVEVRN